MAAVLPRRRWRFVVARLFEVWPRLARIEARDASRQCRFRDGGRALRLRVRRERLRLVCPPSHDGQTQTDDLVYGLTRRKPRGVDWHSAPTDQPVDVDLVGVTADNLDAVIDLATHKHKAGASRGPGFVLVGPSPSSTEA